MIPKESFVAIGGLHKPHGVRGELSASFDDPGLDPAGLKCVVLEMDGIPVPFFIEAARQRGTSSWLLKFEGADDEVAALRLAKHEIFALRDDIPGNIDDDDTVYINDLPGYTIMCADNKIVGVIEDVDDTTANILLIVRRQDCGREAMVPFSDDLLLWIDPETRTLGLDIPAGVLDLND